MGSRMGNFAILGAVHVWRIPILLRAAPAPASTLNATTRPGRVKVVLTRRLAVRVQGQKHAARALPARGWLAAAEVNMWPETPGAPGKLPYLLGFFDFPTRWHKFFRTSSAFGC